MRSRSSWTTKKTKMGMEKPLEFEQPIAALEEELSNLRSKAEDQNLDLGVEMEALQEKLAETLSLIHI